MRPKSDLRGYQQRVVAYLYEHDHAFAILKVGAGKTASALTAIDEMIGDQVIRHGLVLAPKRVANLVWPHEAGEWEHLKGLRVRVANGGSHSRAAVVMAGHRGLHDVTVVGIDNTQWLLDYLAKLPKDSRLFDLLVIDETSKLKSPQSVRARALALNSHRFAIKWGMTGTPRPNSLLDLFTPARIITDAKLWGKSFHKFRQDRFYPSDYKGYSWAVKSECAQPIMDQFATVSMTLRDGEMPDLPDLNVLVEEVELDEHAQDAYDDMERRLFVELGVDPKTGAAKNVEAVSQAVATGKLAQIANGFIYGEGREVTPIHAAKLDWIEELVDELQGEPLIIVYEFIEDLDSLKELFPKMPYLGHGVSDAKGKATVEAWNRGELPLMAMHPASGGHGLNLQHGGSRMAWMSPCWSAEMWEQSLGRLHRPGPGQQGDDPRLLRPRHRRHHEARPRPRQADGAGGLRDVSETQTPWSETVKLILPEKVLLACLVFIYVFNVALFLGML